MGTEPEQVIKKSKKHKRNRSKVEFEHEIISKVKANEILANVQPDENKHGSDGENKKIKIIEQGLPEVTGEINDKEVSKTIRKQKKKKDKLLNGTEPEKGNSDKKSKKKRKIDTTNEEETKKKKGVESEHTEDVDEANNEDSSKKEKTEESIRAKKKRKHQQLLEDKKKKVVLATQENVLNYLSKWKHARDEWKFEKLKQIWLSENLFDSSKIPDQFWEITVDYFSGSKGFIRNLILREALKIVEQEDKIEEKNLEEEYQSRLKRARDAVQSLQE